MGGTGSASALQAMPDFLPDRLEAGTHNMPGIAGLLEGLRYVQTQGTERILTHERRLIRQAAAGLSRIPGVTVYGDGGAVQAGVLSFQIDGMDCEAVGEALGARGIAVRAGLHCAPTGRSVGRDAGGWDSPRQRLRLQYTPGSRALHTGGCAADRRAKIAASAAIFCVCTQGLFTEN